MIKKTLLTACLLVYPVTSWASEVSYLPPLEMVDRALDNYPIYQQATQNIETSRAQAESLRIGSHELTLGGSYTRRQINGLGNFGEYDATLSKGLRIRGKAQLDKESGLLGIEVAKNIAEDARHQTALALKQVWMDWLHASEIRNIRQENVAIHRKSLIALEKRRHLNDASDLDVGLAQSALETSLSLLAIAQSEEELTRAAIAANFPEIIAPPRAPHLPAPDQPVNMQNWSQLVLMRSHEITIAEKKAEQLSVQARRSKLDKYADPTIGLRLFHEQGGNETGIGLSVSMPIGVKQRSAIAARDYSKAKAAQYAATYTRREVDLVAKRDVQMVLNTYRIWQSTVKALERSLFVIEKKRRSYELGAHDYTALLLAEQQFLDSKESEAQARHKAHNAWLQLRIDAHELWLENIH